MMNFTHTKKLLPEIEAAEERFYDEIEDVKTNDEYQKCVKEFNVILEKAIDAIYEDTKDVNSKDTLKQVWLARDVNETHFGIRPLLVIRKFIGLTPD